MIEFENWNRLVLMGRFKEANHLEYNLSFINKLRLLFNYFKLAYSSDGAVTKAHIDFIIWQEAQRRQNDSR